MKLLILLALLHLCASEGSGPQVELPSGLIEGHVKKTLKGREVFSFEGIPYAKPPVGKYRLKDPEPPKPWVGTWPAKTIHICLQLDHFSYKIVGEEDCLYVNVYTPTLNKKAKLDVLVYIHGGAFLFNYGGIQGPELLLDNDIVMVTLNYRLGPLGFLSAEDDVIPGNIGIKDQIAALTWIKNNIESFGGNPNSITISGMSAGGASVHIHYLTNKSKGLFHKGISQSGVALNPWVLAEDNLSKTKKLASLLGCPDENSQEILKCLRKRSGRQIVETIPKFQEWLYNPYSPFGVVVDKWAKDPVLPVHPYKLLKSGKVQDLPWLASYVSAEGLYPAAEFYPEKNLKHLQKHWKSLLQHILHYNETLKDDVTSVNEKVLKYYLKDTKLDRNNFGELVQLIGDRLFLVDIDKAIRLQSSHNKSPVYTYKFSHRGAHSASEQRTKENVNLGASHADDTSYVYKTSLDTTSTKEDKKMSDIMIKIFLTFMKNGSPNIGIDWAPLSKNVEDPIKQLHIAGPSNIKLEEVKYLGNREFWDSLPFEENEKLFTIKDEL